VDCRGHGWRRSSAPWLLFTLREFAASEEAAMTTPAQEWSASGQLEYPRDDSYPLRAAYVA